MSIRFATLLLFGLSTIAAIGCEERTVVTPDADEDGVVVEEQDSVEVDTNTPATPPADTGVNVDVGGEGVNVDVNPGASSDTGTGTDAANDAAPNP